MRIKSAVLFGACLLCSSGPAWSQDLAPPLPPPAPTPFPGPGPGMPPGPPFLPQQPPGQFMPPPMFTAPPGLPSPAQPPAEKLLDLKGRVGFGVGLWVAPVALPTAGSGAPGAAGGLGGLGASVGSTLSIRWWTSDRFFLSPSLRLGISHTKNPGTEVAFQTEVLGNSYTNGAFAPALSLGYAAYRGKSTRFLVSGGLSFGYTVQEVVTYKPDGDGSTVGHYEADKRLTFAVPVGLALEQFFTPRISIVLGAESPLFSFASSRVGNAPARRIIGADFSSTRLSGAFVFYTD